MIYIIILLISILFILYNIIILESFNTDSNKNKLCIKNPNTGEEECSSPVTTSVNTIEYDNEDDYRDDLNFFISPAKDKNGNIIASTKYYHGHDHEHI